MSAAAADAEGEGSMDERVAQLSPVKRALLEWKLKQQGTRRAGGPSPTQSVGDGPQPLAFAQQRLWFFEQWQPGTAVYHIPKAVRLRGRLDRAALQAALDGVVARHEALRTTFRVDGDGKPLQTPGAGGPVPLATFDLSALPAEAREAEAIRLLEDEARRPFDLGRELMLRAAVAALSEEEHLLLLVVHHIAADGWSLGILLRELGELYAAAVTGGTAALAPLPIRYVDYAHWQRQMLQGEEMERQLSYWHDNLAGCATVLELPTDRARARVSAYRGRRETLTLEAQTVSALRELARQEGATLFMVLLAGYALLLGRVSGQEDVVIGSPVAGRGRPETDGLVGFFVNSLALRVRLEGDPTFRALLGQVRQTVLGGLDHQDVPFERLVDALHHDRDLSRNPLFQAIFALQSEPLEGAQWPGLSLEPVEIHNGTCRLDLALEVFERPEGLLCRLEYDADLFAAESARRLLDRYGCLLEGIAANPDGCLSKLPLLLEEERWLLAEWNRTRSDFPRDQCLHHLFEEQVRRTPEAVALEFGEERLTYAELDRRGNRLAHCLRALGTGPEEVVGLCAERSVEMVVGILGVLKAGGAYLPLDPAYPPARLQFMLSDAKPSVLLTQRDLVDGLPEYRGTVVYLDEPGVFEGYPERQSPVTGVAPENLAYVIYTSGSTGRPKGVLVEHRGVVNTIHAVVKQFGIGTGHRMLQLASLSFDASVFEMATALTTGATLVLGRREELLPGPDLHQLLREREVTHAVVTPSALAVLSAEDLPGLEMVLTAGEECPAAVAMRWAPGRRFFNGYGPTEASICATMARCAPGEGKPPIGRPLANTRIYLLDRQGNPVPIGTPGEITIGGVGVARGYLNRPELTGERFLPDPFAGEAGARMYRTGDLGRYRADGSIEYLGRLDDQVKIRGFRIELGEIEAALRACDGVREAVVIAREDTPGEKRLVAYLAPVGDGDAEAPRRALRERLPEYMVPSVFVFLETLPISPNGKVDRRALPAPGAAVQGGAEYVAPRTPVEEALASVWAELLHRERVGANDSFFDLGGHSLLAAQVVSRVREMFGAEVPLRALFEQPTLAAFAELVEDARRKGAPVAGPAFRAQARVPRRAS